MAIALAAENDTQTAASTTGTATVTASAGDLLVCTWVARNGAAFVSAVGSLNGAFTEAEPPITFGGTAGIHFFQNSAAGSETVTITVNASDTIYVNLQRYTGAHLTAALVDGQSVTNGALTTIPHSATGVNATAGQLMVTVAAQSATITDETVATGFTALALTAGNGRQWWQFRIATGTESSQVAAYTASSHSSACIIALFDQAAAAAGYTPRMMLLGVG